MTSNKTKIIQRVPKGWGYDRKDAWCSRFHTEKRLFDIRVPSRDVTYQTLARLDVIIPAQGEFGK